MFLSQEEVRGKAVALGAALVGFSRLNADGCEDEGWKNFIRANPYSVAISLAYPISIEVCDTLLEQTNGETLRAFMTHVRGRAEVLDSIGTKLVAFIEEKGFSALLIPRKGFPCKKELPAVPLSHMKYARLSGIGSMGDSGMLLTREYGPRVRLSTILTNCIDVDGIKTHLMEEICTHCGACGDICPSGCITGGRFRLDDPQTQYVLKDVCERYRVKNNEIYGTRFCNLCMASCSIGMDRTATMGR